MNDIYLRTMVLLSPVLEEWGSGVESSVCLGFPETSSTCLNPFGRQGHDAGASAVPLKGLNVGDVYANVQAYYSYGIGRRWDRQTGGRCDALSSSLDTAAHGDQAF